MGDAQSMKSNLFECRWPLVAAFAGLLAFSATAQKEQWLEYRSGGDDLRGYRWVELSTNPPPNVPLPQLRAFAEFGEWKNGFGGSRWFCFDRARKTGGSDRMFFDSNGNGRLDDEKPVTTTQRDGGSVAMFPAAKLVFKGEDGPISYHLQVRYYQMGDERAQLLVASGGWYEGMVGIAGKKRKVQLFDNTVNGVFNDVGLGASECDSLLIDNKMSYLGRFLEFDGQLYRLDVARDGACMKLQKAENVQTAVVRVPETISEFQAVGENGHFTRKPVKGELTIPAGKYRVLNWSINRKDDKGASWTLSGSGFNQSADFEAAAKDAVTLQIGEPIRPVLEARESKSQVEFGLRLLGPMDETVDILRGQERPTAPKINIASVNGTFRATNTFEYG